MGGKALNGNKITREQAYDLYNHIINTHKLHRKHNRIQLCGSARRGKKKCGDLDIVFQDNETGDFKAWLLETFGTKKNGSHKPQCSTMEFKWSSMRQPKILGARAL